MALAGVFTGVLYLNERYFYPESREPGFTTRDRLLHSACVAFGSYVICKLATLMDEDDDQNEDQDEETTGNNGTPSGEQKPDDQRK